MKEFIEWCNDNQGFLTFLLSTFTILISIIAIIVSIRTAKLPYYKRAILNSTQNYIVKAGNVSPVPYEIELSFSNIGNCPIGLHTLAIGFHYKNNMSQLYSLEDGNISEQIVQPAGIVRHKYKFSNIVLFLKDESSKNNSRINLNTKLYIFARDTEGKTYKRFYGTVENILKLLPSNKTSD